MNIANVTVKNEWVDIQDLISEATGDDFEFTPNINYYLSNSTGTPVLFLNVDSLPDETVNKGLVVAGFEQCGFKLASENAGVMAYVSDLDCLAYCTGTAWKQIALAALPDIV